MTADELKTVFGCILLTGYSKLPHRRMYWYSSGDVPSLLSQSTLESRKEHNMNLDWEVMWYWA